MLLYVHIWYRAHTIVSHTCIYRGVCSLALRQITVNNLHWMFLTVAIKIMFPFRLRSTISMQCRMVTLPVGHIQTVLKSKTISVWWWRSALLRSRRSGNFKGKDCISHVPRRFLEWTKARTSSASKHPSNFVAPSSSSSQNMVSDRHLSYERSRHASQGLV